jgi:uncharacterized protein (UPF0335 family)
MSDTVDSVAAAQLKGIVARIERLETEIKELNDDKSDIYKEAKSSGFDTAVLRKLVAERRKDPTDLETENTVLDLYRHALSAGTEAPLVRVHVHEAQQAADQRAALPPHNPETGEVIEDRVAPAGASPTESSEHSADESSDTNSREPARETDSSGDLGHAIAPSDLAQPFGGDRSMAGLSRPINSEMDRDGGTTALPKNPVPAESARKAIPARPEDGSAHHADAGESPAAMTSLADARLLTRIVQSKAKGIDIMDSGDSLRVDRLVRDGAIIRENGRLYAAAYRRSA